MPDYTSLKNTCDSEKEIAAQVIDNFLIYYAAKRNRCDLEFDARVSRFSHIKKDMPGQWIGMCKSQYIAHRIFRQDGLINKFLNHAAIKELTAAELAFLHKTAAYPWRFSFSEIINSPAPGFFKMEDVFTGEQFLLYSQSVTQILKEHPVLLWFNLISFNGACWQTFGTVAGFRSFDADDIFFYGGEVNASIESKEDLVKDIENNPVPYSALYAGSRYPLVWHENFEIVQLVSTIVAASLNEKHVNQFHIERAGEVVKISHKAWSEFPHNAEAFYDAKEKKLLVSAHTDKGYKATIKLLNSNGFKLPAEADVRIHFPMLSFITNTLKRNVELNPYSKMFEEAHTGDEAGIDKLNKLLRLAMPSINAGKEPDINALAIKAGINPETAGLLIKDMLAARRR